MAEVVNQSPESPADTPGDGTVADAIAAELAALEASDNAPAEGNAEPEKAEGDDNAPTESDPESEAPEPEEEPAAKAVEIEYEGKKYNVAPELKDAFLRQADYTRKAMELADTRKQLADRQQQTEAVYQAAQHFSQGLAASSAVENQIAQTVKYLQDNPSLATTDPVQFSTLTGSLSLLQVQRGQLQAGLNRSMQQYAEFQQAKRADQIKSGAKFLADRGLSSDALQPLSGYLKESGITPKLIQELDDGADPAALILFDKARRYDEIQAKKPQVQSKAAQAAPVVRPGAVTPKTTSVEIYGKKLKSSGTVNDAVALELARMERAARR